MTKNAKCGFITIVGRANVGKSTLFNNLLNEQLSITTHKPQTTRHNIHGVLTLESCQLILADTPGIQLGNRRLINKVLIHNALSSLQEVDIILMLVELDRWNDEDEYLLTKIKQVNCPVMLVINKIDKLKHKADLLPMLKNAETRHDFTDIIPLSALHDKNTNVLVKKLYEHSPYSEFLFPKDMKWDRDDLFVISEIVRGAAMLQLQKELPYAIYTESDS